MDLWCCPYDLGRPRYECCVFILSHRVGIQYQETYIVRSVSHPKPEPEASPETSGTSPLSANDLDPYDPYSSVTSEDSQIYSTVSQFNLNYGSSRFLFNPENTMGESLFPFYHFGFSGQSYFHQAVHVFELAITMTHILAGAVIGYLVMGWTFRVEGWIVAIAPIVALCIFLLSVMVPFFPPNWSTRLSLGIVLFQVLIALIWPFFGVEFVHVLIGDALTSASTLLWNLELGICWSFYGFFTDESVCDTGHNPTYLHPAILALPFWIRFVQCVYRIVVTRHHGFTWPCLQHFVNAMKYQSAIMVVVTSTLLQYYSELPFMRAVWLLALFIKTIYCYIWDITMDWSLGKIRGKGDQWPFMLREKRFYPTCWYYFAMFSNLLMRFSWATALSPHLNLPKYVGTIMALIEILRRAQWFIFRTENEFLQKMQPHMTNNLIQ